MAAIQLKEGKEFDGKSLAKAVYDHLPGYAVPLFVRVVESLAHTSTFKSQKVDLRKEGYGPDVDGPALRAGRSRRGLRAVLRRVPRRGRDGKRPK